MKELSAHLQKAGFENIRTYIQSGNIVLSSDHNPESDIAALILSDFGFTAQIMVLLKDQFESAVANNPYQEFEGKLVHFYFCNQSPKLNISKLEGLISDTERHTIIDKVFYLHAPDGIGRSKLVAKIETVLGVAATGRNLNTINKLKAMVEQA